MTKLTLAELQDQVTESVKSKYSYLEDADIEKAFNFALADYLMLRYPTENNRPEKELLEITFVVEQWILQRMDDILSRGGGTNVTAYRENGISWTYASSYIDKSLASLVVPKASTPQ